MDLTPKIPDSLLSKVSGYISKEALIEMKQRENAALAMCGGLLGNCYLLAEVVENLMINAMNNFSKEKWFKQDIKCYIKKAKEETHITIANSINNSPTDADYMREVADAIYEIIKPDLFKLNNAVLLELNKRKVQYSTLSKEAIKILVFKNYIKKLKKHLLED